MRCVRAPIARLGLVVCLAWSVLAAVPGVEAAGGHSVPLDKMSLDLGDREALTRGAETFVNYCLPCHGASLMRYKRVGEDLGLSEEEVRSRLILGDAKFGDGMQTAMRPEYGAVAFGVAPPDLSLIARVRGKDWLYTYLRSYYADPSRPSCFNNTVFKDTAMPNVFWRDQGIRTVVVDSGGHGAPEDSKAAGHKQASAPVPQGRTLSSQEFDALVNELVSFMVYMAEPARLQRHAIAPWVLLYLAVFLVVIYLLKREVWRDVRH